MSQLYGIGSSRTNRWRTTRDGLPPYLILAMTCEPVPRYLTRKGCHVIRGFHRHPGSRALPYLEALARRWRYGITLFNIICTVRKKALFSYYQYNAHSFLIFYWTYVLSTIIKSISEKISTETVLASLAHVVRILLFLSLFTFDAGTTT